MGRRLIIKGADFSQNAVSVVPNYEELKIGSSEGLWSSATSLVTPNADPTKDTFYGFLCPYDGYITGLRIKAESLTQEGWEPSVAIFEAGEGATTRYISKSALKESVEIGVNDYTLVSPLKVTQGQVVAVHGVRFYYSTTGGDWQTTTRNGTLQGEPYRIYSLNLIIQKEVV